MENEHQPGVFYTLEALAEVTGVSRREILIYHKSGLIRARAADASDEPVFDDEAVYCVRRIEHLRGVQGINLAGIRIIFELIEEIRRLEDEMRFLRP